MVEERWPLAVDGRCEEKEEKDEVWLRLVRSRSVCPVMGVSGLDIYCVHCVCTSTGTAACLVILW